MFQWSNGMYYHLAVDFRQVFALYYLPPFTMYYLDVFKKHSNLEKCNQKLKKLCLEKN